jgi:hypothetical protein
MYALGVVEITTGAMVFLLPRFAPYVVADSRYPGAHPGA